MNYIKKWISKWANKGLMTCTIVRYHETETETLGLLFIDGEFICYTLELPWKDNSRNISCIPEDTYSVLPHKDKYRVQNVGGRSGINIEVGNSFDDILGCIIVGTGILEFVSDKHNIFLHSSKLAFSRIKSIIGDNEFRLSVTNISRV